VRRELEPGGTATAFLENPEKEVKIYMSILNWLEEWYESNCDGDWEHAFGVEIRTLDNPGWRVRLCLIDTIYEGIIFRDIKIEREDNDWVYCRKKDGNIDCAGGTKNLIEMLTLIKKWMGENSPV
jgi:hypothetical protein